MILFNQQLLPRGGVHFMEYQMSKDYSQIDIDGPGGRLSFGDVSFGTFAVVGAIVALTIFLLAFLLVSF
jgi:hypothetical protein